MGRIEKLTKEILLKAAWKAKRQERAFIYLCISGVGKDRGVHLYINSASPGLYCSQNTVLVYMSPYDIVDDHVDFREDNTRIYSMDLDEFVAWFNEEYKDEF